MRLEARKFQAKTTQRVHVCTVSNAERKQDNYFYMYMQDTQWPSLNASQTALVHIKVTAGLLTGCGKKMKIVQVLGGKLCGEKRRLCGIAQICKQENIQSPGLP